MNSCVDQKLIDPENMKIFEKVMPYWHKLIKKASTWKELDSVTYYKNEHGDTLLLSIGYHPFCIVGEIYGFKSNYIVKDDGQYDARLMAIAKKFNSIVKRGKESECQKQTKEIDVKLNEIRTTFSEQINECVNHLKKEYPEKCGITLNAEETA